MKKAASTTKRTTSKKPKTEGLGVIGELDRYLFGEGRHYQLYHKLGAHPYTYRGQDGYYFAVWAPHAAAVSLVGDFNAWNPDATPMKPVADSGIYELFVPGLGVGQLYKFAITTHTGTILFKADPYAFSAEYRRFHSFPAPDPPLCGIFLQFSTENPPAAQYNPQSLAAAPSALNRTAVSARM